MVIYIQIAWKLIRSGKVHSRENQSVGSRKGAVILEFVVNSQEVRCSAVECQQAENGS
jgi:hypothetical protein